MENKVKIGPNACLYRSTPTTPMDDKLLIAQDDVPDAKSVVEYFSETYRSLTSFQKQGLKRIIEAQRAQGRREAAEAAAEMIKRGIAIGDIDVIKHAWMQKTLEYILGPASDEKTDKGEI
jgi:hypothetical protein